MTATLQTVAAACWHGASNPVALLNALSEAMRLRIGPLTPEDRIDLRVIRDHLDTLIPPLSELDLIFDLSLRYANPLEIAA